MEQNVDRHWMGEIRKTQSAMEWCRTSEPVVWSAFVHLAAARSSLTASAPVWGELIASNVQITTGVHQSNVFDYFPLICRNLSDAPVSNELRGMGIACS